MNEKTEEIRPFESVSRTDVGLVREKNEDSFMQADTVNGSLFAVFDGMGGHRYGEIASQTAAQTFKLVFEIAWEENVNILFETAFIEANTAIRTLFADLPDDHKPGTTAVIILVRDTKVYFAHIGDSRIYHASHKRLTQLTKDHSVVQDMIDEGIITEKQARTHPRRNQITAALGIDEIPLFEICTEPLLPADDDVILLCTDGLNSMLRDKEIHNAVFSSENLEQKAEALIKAALNAGGHDNVTVQLVRFFNTGNTAVSYKKKNSEKTNRTTEQKKKKTKTWMIRLIIVGVILASVAVFGLLNRNKHYNFTSPCTIYFANDSVICFTSGNNPEIYAHFYNTKTDSIFSSTQRNMLNFRIGECVTKPKPK